MSKSITSILSALALLATAAVPAYAQGSGEEARARQIEAIEKSLHPQSGDVTIPEAKATLHLGRDYYFLPPEDARRVIVEGWGNPPDSASDVLGLVFPAGASFASDSWGAVITYKDTGFVTDDDAQSTDYDAMLKDMQEQEGELNAERSKQGYPTQHLVGWAQAPLYDPTNHSVVWAQNIQFAGQSENTLNYDVRLLGRIGVLSLNMVTGMSKLGETQTAATAFARTASFDAGARYADFNPKVDAKAGFGIAGLVAGGVGLAVAKKAGLLAVILAFGKKAIILLVAVGGALAARFRRFFGRKEDPLEGYAPPSAGEDEPPAQGA